MSTVKIAFATNMKRLHEGDHVTPADCNSPEHFDRLVELGYIGADEPTPAAPAAEATLDHTDPV